MNAAASAQASKVGECDVNPIVPTVPASANMPPAAAYQPSLRSSFTVLQHIGITRRIRGSWPRFPA
jgi:hypothetical protein